MRVMKITALHLILTAWLCCCCFSQNTEEFLLASVREAIEEIKSLSQRLTELKTGQGHIQDTQNEASIQINGQLEEMKGCLSPDSFMADFVEILELERDLQKDFLNRTCRVEQITELQKSFSLEFHMMYESMQGCSSGEQLSNLTVLLATDECAESSHGCSPNAVCEDELVRYRCYCLPGYVGDGFICDDVNECSSGDSKCHDHAQCENIVGNYSCVCNQGYYGDGFLCAMCESPSKWITGIGCIFVVEKLMKWLDAKMNCLQQNSQLLEGLSSHDQLDELKTHFDIAGGNSIFVGFFKEKWVESQTPIQPSTLWGSSEPTGRSEECGYVRLYESIPSIGDFKCSERKPSLCQMKA